METQDKINDTSETFNCVILGRNNRLANDGVIVTPIKGVARKMYEVIPTFKDRKFEMSNVENKKKLQLVA